MRTVFCHFTPNPKVAKLSNLWQSVEYSNKLEVVLGSTEMIYSISIPIWFMRVCANHGQSIRCECATNCSSVTVAQQHETNHNRKHIPKRISYRQHRRLVDSQSIALFQRPKPIETQQFFSQSLKKPR